MVPKIFSTRTRSLSFILLISLCLYPAFSFDQSPQPTGWSRLYSETTQNIPYSLPNKTLEDNSSNIRLVNKDSTIFTELKFKFPGVVAGDASWFDYDNDGDLDVFVSGYTDSIFISKIYRNDKGDFTDIGANILQLGTERGVAWGDYDNDGDFDLAILGTIDTTMLNNFTKIYRNDDGNFVDINAALLGLVGGSVVWADIDNDGLLDLLTSGSTDNGRSFFTKIYKNTKENFVDIAANLPGVWGSSIAFGDYDNDGDLDILLTGYGHYGTISRLYRNEITNDTIVFVDTHTPLHPVNSSSVAWGDYNNDGYLDIALAGSSFNGPVTKIYRNNNGLSFVDINAPLKPLGVSALSWGDYDNDGYLDLVVSGAEDFWYGTNPTTKIYRNDKGTFVDMNADIIGTWFGSANWGDYNNDGKLDLLITGATIARPYQYYWGPYYPTTKIYKNNSIGCNTTPSAPINLSIIESDSKIRLKWDPATDDQTPSTSLTYNIRIGKTPGGHEIVSPIANVPTGYRRTPKFGNQSFMKKWDIKNLAPGTYYWSVQAVDNGYTGSLFAQEQSFTVTTSGKIIDNILPYNFYLYQNYPNPFNPSTRIAFSLLKETFFSLKVFDILGRELVSLMNQVKPKGTYEIEWDASHFPAGVYYYKLETPEYVDIKKMILIK